MHAKDGALLLEDSAASTLRNISDQLTNIGFSRQNDTHDTTTFGKEGHTFIAGLTNGTITIDGWWDKTASTGSATVLDSLMGLDAVTLGWEYMPEGNVNGNVKYSGECVLASLDFTQPVADLISFSATLQISGDVTKGTVSA
jgi:hypothetical protein